MEKKGTSLPDWSSLMPVRAGDGPRGAALYRALRRMIEGGQAPPGAKLPPSRVLAAQAGIARNAVVAAFEQLVAEGYVEARVGAGSFVARDVPRLAPAAPKPLAGPALLPVLPGRLGSAMADPRSFDMLRKLLARHLARPTARHLHYGDPRGARPLREAIAGYLRSARAVRVHADQVMVTSGAQQAIDIVARAALAPGDAAWIENPAYPMAAALLRGIGVRLVPVRVDAEGLDVAAGRRAAPGARAAYVTPSHQFPTGVAMTMRRRLELLSWAREAGAWIIEDDYDGEFSFGGPPLPTLKSIDTHERVLYVGTFSKSLFPSLRLGYLLAPPSLVETLQTMMTRLLQGVPASVQSVVAEFIDEGHFASHLRRMRRIYAERHDTLCAAARRELAGLLEVMPSHGGLHTTARFVPRLSEAAVTEAALRRDITVSPLSRYSLTRVPSRGLVLGFGAIRPPDIEAGVRNLGRALAPLAGG